MIIKNLQKSQKQYLELLKEYEEIVFSQDVNQRQIAMLLDEIQCFWLNKKDILKIELEMMTSEKECCMLCGVVYLDIKDNEHYIFKSLGEEHIISDPLLKIENFFRVPPSIFSAESVVLFQEAFSDVLNILMEYQNNFYILPINQIAISDEKEHYGLLQDYYLMFINSILDENFDSFDDFFDKYTTYEEIENNMSSFSKNSLTFSDLNDERLSLKEKVESHLNSHSSLGAICKHKSDCEKFILSLQSWVVQVIEIIMISVITNIVPFIRYKPTFHYLTIVMYTFIEDKYVKNMIEKSIVYYIFYNNVNKNDLIEMNFNDFLKVIKKHDFLNLIILEIRKNKIDIFKGGLEKVGNIIDNIFSNVIKNRIKQDFNKE